MSDFQDIEVRIQDNSTLWPMGKVHPIVTQTNVHARALLSNYLIWTSYIIFNESGPSTPVTPHEPMLTFDPIT